MHSSPHQSIRKTKISLSDYSFRRDIETRLLMAQFGVKEVEVLHEIIHHSLKISIEQLAEEMGMEVENLVQILDQLAPTQLFKRQNMTLLVDKEMRKYFEVKLEKFDPDFRPDLEFLQGVLNKVPIHVLPLWYAIPRTSDHIFGSIIEKYFLTPKIYRQYLNEIEFDLPILKLIMQEVYQPPHFKVTANHLLTKFQLTRECLEEYLLLLEYHLVCCVSYQRVEDRWEEVITPFAEWHEYLLFEVQTQPSSIQDAIEKEQHVEFQFIKDFTILLDACKSEKINPQEVRDLYSLSSQHQKILNKLIQVKFIEQSPNGQILATEMGKNWLLKPLYEQIAILANHPLNQLSNIAEFASLWNARNLRLIEKSLRCLVPDEWVKFHDFLEGFTVPIGHKEPVTLKNKGKKWKYELPTYTSQEKQFIESVIMERLSELGVVETGLFEGNFCFRLTLFGYHFIH